MDDLLKEAIADAKAVRETALENAKIALEEAFTPRLQSMLSKKIQSEIEVEEGEHEDDEDVDYEECSVSLSPFRKDLKVNLSTLNNVWGLNSLTHNLLHKEVDFDEYRDFIKSFDKLYCISEERYEPLRKLFKNVSYTVIHTEDEYWEDVMANRDL